MRVLSKAELREKKGIPYSRVHLDRLVKAGRFPAPIKLGANRIGFIEDEIDEFLARRVAERDELRAA